MRCSASICRRYFARRSLWKSSWTIWRRRWALRGSWEALPFFFAGNMGKGKGFINVFLFKSHVSKGQYGLESGGLSFAFFQKNQEPASGGNFGFVPGLDSRESLQRDLQEQEGSGVLAPWHLAAQEAEKKEARKEQQPALSFSPGDLFRTPVNTFFFNQSKPNQSFLRKYRAP